MITKKCQCNYSGCPLSVELTPEENKSIRGNIIIVRGCHIGHPPGARYVEQNDKYSIYRPCN